MAVLSKIRALFQQRQLTAAEAYKQLVLQIVDKGEQPSDALDVCLAAQRTPGDLERDVTTLAARLEAVQNLEFAKGLVKQEADLCDKSVKTYHDLEAMEVRHREAERAKRAEWQNLERERRLLDNQMGSTRESAMRTLTNTADPTIGQQIAMLQHEREGLLREKEQSRDMFAAINQADLQRGKFVDLTRWIADANNPDLNPSEQVAARKRVQDQAPINRAHQQAQEIQQMLQNNDQRIAEIGKEIEALEKKRLDPYAFRFSE